MPASSFFTWTSWVDKILFPFWWVIVMLIVFIIPFLRVWWWLIFPLVLSLELRTLYLWWIKWDSGASASYAAMKWITLEIIPSKEVLVPIKAMEDILTTVWPIWDHPNWREEWCEGLRENSPFWWSFEIVSTEGGIHFYLRVTQAHRTTLETALYGHYPEIEIHEVPDYIKVLPQNIPNQEWDMYGEDWVLRRPAAYPIKTYEKFFEPQGERIAAEEKRIDSLASLLEMMSRLGPGEHYWMQFIMVPVDDKHDEPKWKKEAQAIIDKLAKRPQKKEISLWEDLMLVLEHVIMGPKKEGSGEKASYKWTEIAISEEGEREMVLTPGERELITEIENKMKKPTYKCHLRGVYVARRENWNGSRKALARAYYSHFLTENMNGIVFTGDTRPKVHYLWRKRRALTRARIMMRNTALRFPAAFPNRRKYAAILSTEEVATIFHFPIKISGVVAPTVVRVESKKAGPPPNLPI